MRCRYRPQMPSTTTAAHYFARSLSEDPAPIAERNELDSPFTSTAVRAQYARPLG